MLQTMYALRFELELALLLNCAGYAEFYNVSIEACPKDCNGADGKQQVCGEFVTPCGNKVTCGKTCSDGNVSRGSARDAPDA